jgi:hypothetical protein
LHGSWSIHLGIEAANLPILTQALMHGWQITGVIAWSPW